MEELRIGVLGAARIAPAAVIKPAGTLPGVEVAAVAARDGGRAQAFADKHGIGRVHRSYDDLLADPDIDAVYNPLPNGLHGRWTIAALEAGKHVLCEKPFTANRDEAEAVEGVAASSGKVVMEAFHYRYHPLAARVREIVDSGELGDLVHVEAWECFPLPRFSDIRYQLDLAGGALMDAGCYAVHMVRLAGGGEPEVLSAQPKLHGEQIDRAMRAELRFPDGHTGRVGCSMWSTSLLRLSIRVEGSAGELRVFNPVAPQMYHRLSVRAPSGRRIERFGRRATYSYQLEAFRDAVGGRPEANLTPPSDSIATMAVIDAIYEAAGMMPRQPTGSTAGS
jgi:predicted dehydrogenase